LIEQSADILIVLDLEHRITSGNLSLEKILGYPSQDVIGLSIFDLIHPDDRHNLTDLFTLVKYDQSESTRLIELRLRHARGGYLVFEAKARKIIDLKANACNLINLRDISDRIAMMKELDQQQEFSKSIYDGVELAIAVVEIDEKGEIRFAGLNPAHEKMSGIKKNDVVGKKVRELVPHVLKEEDAKRFSEIVDQCIHEGKPQVFEELVPFGENGVWWLTRLTPFAC